MKLWVKWLILGGLSILFGLFVLANPVAASIAVTVMAGITFCLMGGVQIYAGVTTDEKLSKIMGIVLGALLILLGISLTFHPLSGLLSLTTVVTILIGANGIIRLITSFQMRDTPMFWPMLISGGLSVLLAAYVIANFADIAPQLLGILMGVELLFNGLGLVALGIFLRTATDELKAKLESRDKR